MQTEMQWSNEMGSRSRVAWLLLVKDGAVHVFRGDSISGVVAVTGHDYRKNGKWSHTTYRVMLADGVTAIPGRNGWETGRFIEGLRSATGKPTDKWADVANALGVTVPVAQKFMRESGSETRKRDAEALDKVEEALAAVDEVAPSGSCELSLSFGSPTRRLRDEGYWNWPVVVYTSDAEGAQEVGRLIPGEYGWGSGVASSSEQVRVLSCEKSSGHGGGYVSLRIAAPAGAVARHERAEVVEQS